MFLFSFEPKNFMMRFHKLFYLSILLFSIVACNNEDSITDDKIGGGATASIVGNMAVKPIEGQFIVVFSDEIRNDILTQEQDYDQGIQAVKEKSDELLSDLNIPLSNGEDKYFSQALTGFVAKLSPAEVEMLENDSRIKYVEQDFIIGYDPVDFLDFFSNSPNQRTPYGTTRVGSADGTGKTAWVIDTGVDLDHEDLNVDSNRSRTFATGTVTADDNNGHGSHVAGTIGAIDNAIGSKGVAPNATIVGVKVLGANGSGQLSDVIQGVDYVASAGSPGEVANLSLSGGEHKPLDEAVQNMADRGIFAILAAGNSGESATQYSPARTNGTNIYTVSAFDANDNFASFSNFGTPVDYAQPGVDIYSTSNDNGYATLSGTSMAAPHLAGVLLITEGNPNTDGMVNGDPDEEDDPIATL